MTAKQIVAMLVDKINDIATFASVVDASSTPRAEKSTPQALVGFVESRMIDSEYESLTEEIYSVLVVCNQADATEDILTLLETVRTTVHGQVWTATDIWPFAWISTSRVDSDQGSIAYEMQFMTKRTVDWGL